LPFVILLPRSAESGGGDGEDFGVGFGWPAAVVGGFYAGEVGLADDDAHVIDEGGLSITVGDGVHVIADKHAAGQAGPPSPAVVSVFFQSRNTAEGFKAVFQSNAIDQQAGEFMGAVLGAGGIAGVQVDGESKGLAGGEIIKGLGVVVGFAVGAAGADDFLVHQLRIGGNGDVEDGQLDTLHPGELACVLGVFTDGQQVVFVHHLNVVGIAGDFEFADDGGIGWVGQVEGEKRVDAFEGDQKAAIADEAGGVDFFAGGNVFDAADDLEFFSVF